MANVLIKQNPGGNSWKTQNSITLAASATNTSDAIPCGDHTHFCLIAWGTSVSTSVQISHDGTTYKELSADTAAATIVDYGLLNAEYIKIAIKNEHGSEDTDINGHLRLSKNI